MGDIQSSRLLYECPAETRLTVYRRFSITRRAEILPAKRVILTLGAIAWTLDRRHLVHWMSGLKFN